LGALGQPYVAAVTGLAFEARIVAGPGVTVICGGNHAQLKRSLEAALRQGCRGILSFGVAGGLAPQLKPGTCVVARNIISDNGRYASHHDWTRSLLETIQGAVHGDIAGSDEVVACTRGKRTLHEKTGAVAVDMESHVAARFAAEHGVPFAALRVITDPSNRVLPPAALVATRREGTVDVPAIVWSLIANPRQVPTLIRVALDSWAARQTLVPSRRFLGPSLGLPDIREHLLDVA
jgi:adenosylhomocysteine nucleosidase